MSLNNENDEKQDDPVFLEVELSCYVPLSSIAAGNIDGLCAKMIGTLNNDLLSARKSPEQAPSYEIVDEIVTIKLEFIINGSSSLSENDAFVILLNLLVVPRSAVQFEGGFPSLVSKANENFFLEKNLTLKCNAIERSVSAEEYNLLWAAKNNRIVLLTGTGMSKALTGDDFSIWNDFLKALHTSVWPENDKASFDVELFTRLENNPHAQSEYLYVCAERDSRSSKVVSTILLLMSRLMPQNYVDGAWKIPLQNFTGPILTLNYDISLEVAIGRSPVSKHNLGNLRDHVVHLHGIFTDHESIVLRQKTYLDAAKWVPDFLIDFAEQGCIFVYVGVGSALNDPDLTLYYRYEEIRHLLRENRPIKHNHLVLSANTPNFSKGSDGKSYSFFKHVYVESENLLNVVGEIVCGKYRG